jgi:hypothetical protein
MKTIKSKEPEEIWEITDDDLEGIVNNKPGIVQKVGKPVEAVPPGVLCENDPKSTVMRLFKSPPDSDFVFYTQAGRGLVYLNNMRQVITRARKIAKKDTKPVVHWKVLVKEFVEGSNHDTFTVVRTLSSSIRQKSVYDELIETMGAGAIGED